MDLKSKSYICLLLLLSAGLFNLARGMNNFESDESIEILNNKFDQRYQELPQYRPIMELLLGVLNTFHSSTKEELMKAKKNFNFEDAI